MNDRRQLPIWAQIKNKLTDEDLNRFAVDEIVNKIEKVSQLGLAPAELQDLKDKANRLVIGYDLIQNATKADRKYRAKLLELYQEIRQNLADLFTKTGFDLFDESTWNQ